MRTRRRFRPFLERLEARDCPSLTTTYSLGTLTLSGTPTGSAPGAQLLIQRMGGTNYQVSDNGITIGTFANVSSLRLNLQSYRENITVDLVGGTFPGSISMSLGKGDVDPSAMPGIVTPHPITITGGPGSVVTGSVTVQGGSGQEVLDIGQEPLPGSPIPVTVAGSVNFTGAPNAGFAGNAIVIGPGSVVGTDVVATQVSQVTVGSFTAAAGAVGRNLAVNDTNSTIGVSLDILGRVSGNVSVSGTNVGDFLVLDNNTPGPAGSVGGNFAANLGSGGGSGNFIFTDAGTTVGGGFTATGGNGGVFALFNGTIHGSLGLTFGSGTNTISTPGAVGQNTTLSLGTGTNMVTLDGTIGGQASVFTGAAANTIDTTGGTVGGAAVFNLGNGTNMLTLGGLLGSVSYTGGAGTNSIDLTGTVARSVVVNMGNGVNSFTLDVGAQILGPTLQYTGGTNSDTVVLQNGIINPFAVDVIFKAGTRSLTYTAGTEPARDFIDFGTGPGTKSLSIADPITWPHTVLNYP